VNIEKCRENFIFYCLYQKNLSQKTIKAYNIDLNQLIEYSNNTKIESIDKVFIKEYIKSLFDKNLKEKSIKRKIATLKAFFSYLEDEEIIYLSPFTKLKLKIKEPQRLPKTITLKEIKKLFVYIYKLKDNIQPDTYKYKSLVRDIVIIEFLFATGMRVAEVCSLKLSDIDLSSSQITIIGKGDKQRVVKLCDSSIKDILKEYIGLFSEQIEQKGWLFINRLDSKLSEQSVRFMIKRYQQEAKIEKHITPHMFRHTVATLLLEEGVDIRYIQHILGHSNISTTQIYTKVNQKHQNKILVTKHPRRGMV
jgi:integrase/recombinase XerD